MIRLDKFAGIFTEWVNSINDLSLKEQVIALDGKTLKGSNGNFHNQPAVHLVRASALAQTYYLRVWAQAPLFLTIY